jgi:hypothetical protein
LSRKKTLAGENEWQTAFGGRRRKRIDFVETSRLEESRAETNPSGADTPSRRYGDTFPSRPTGQGNRWLIFQK